MLPTPFARRDGSRSGWAARLPWLGLPWLCGACWGAGAEPPAEPPAQDVVTVTRPEADSPSAWRRRVREELASLPQPEPLPTVGAHPIDALLAGWWSDRGLTEPEPCDDRRFVRRIHLDLVGLLPDEDVVRRFVDDTSAHKRTVLIDRLLADDAAYAEHWITFWADLLRDDQATYIAVTRHPITAWLLAALRTNKPYDEMVAALLDPREPEAAGFARGIEWSFSSSVSEIPSMQVAQVTAQVFLGVNLKCASCHDHFTRPWRLEQSWAFAGYFAADNLQPHRCDVPHGAAAAPKFLFDALEDEASGGPLAADADLAARRRAAAVLVTRPRNPRFARTLVNRLFKKLIGQGLIDATDDLDGRTAFRPELLDRLAYDFMAGDYDLRRLLRTIVTSRVYQMQPADGERPAEASDDEPPFVGPRLRRLTAEQFLDAICCVTGDWPAAAPISVRVDNPRVRAWRHAAPNRVAVMLGRSNREVVVSARPDRASMLEALEMVNGDVLAGYLAGGARRILASGPGTATDPSRIVDTLTLRAYARPATAEEQAVARELLGPAGDRQAGCEDLLWLLVMNPEFQYLY